MPFNHTPGPIRAGKPTDAIVSDTDIGTAHRQSDSSRAYYGGHLIAESVSTDNRRRMIAMWNACEGIPTEVLEAQQSGGLPWSVADQIDARMERDRLLAALREIEALDSSVIGLDRIEYARQVARNAIARTEKSPDLGTAFDPNAAPEA